jgi:hypothetical protein
MVTFVGATFSVEGVAFPSTVFHERKPDPSRTSDGGILGVTTFLMASLLNLVSATPPPSIDAFAPRRPVCGWVWALQREVEAATSGDVARQR